MNNHQFPALTDHQKAMVEVQHQLEEDSRERARQIFDIQTEKLQQVGMTEKTYAGKVLLNGSMQAMVDAIQAFIDKAYSGRPGRRHKAAAPIKELGAEKAAFIALNVIVAGLHHQRRTFTAVAREIGIRVDDELRLSKLREEHTAAYRRAIRGAAERIGYSYKRVYALKVLADNMESCEAAPEDVRLHTGFKLAELVAEATGMVTIEQVGVGTGKFEYRVLATEEALKWVDERNLSKSLQRSLYEPMVCPPRDWDGAWGGGYLSPNVTPFPLVKATAKGYLSELSNAHMPAVYKAINAAQRTAWAINKDVLAVMKWAWDEGRQIAGLPPRYGLEVPPRPANADDDAAANKAWRKEASTVYQANARTASQRATVTSAINTAERYAEYTEIYFPYQFDFRGRMYAVPSFNPQGSDPVKGLLVFAHGKPVGEDGEKWLAVQGANLAGYDKVSHQDRYDWVTENEEAILACAADPYNNRDWCGTIGGVEIDSPWQFLGWCFEWAGFCKYGADWVSRIPCTMDGSCSGIQHFSAMLRDPVGGAAVNLIPADKPQDVYAVVANKVLPLVQADAENGTEDSIAHHEDGTAFRKLGTKELAKRWLAHGINRKVTKRPVMTLCYGATLTGFREQITEDTIKPYQENAALAKTEDVFGDYGKQAATYMGDLTWAAVSTTLVAAHEAMSWLRKVSGMVAKENLPVRWVSPSGFPVWQACWDTKLDRIELSLGGKVARTAVHREQPTISAPKTRAAISPNFVHSCDAAHLTLTVAAATDAGLTSFALVHDSFGTLAADMDAFYTVVRREFVGMYTRADVLECFKEDVSALLPDASKVPALPEKGALELGAVLQSAYCFA